MDTHFFLNVCVATALGMLVWDCIEVGRNDAANLVNAVFGARVMRRRVAVRLAGIAVILGATFASPVMETARKGIFDPTQLTIAGAMTVYITAYVVDTVLLYTYSAFGMPVSTTASLVFELVGASVGVYTGMGIVHWGRVGTIINEIIASILLSGVAGFLIQRAFRGAIGENAQDSKRVMLHGPWMAGLMLTWLIWFMLMKGLNAVALVGKLKSATIDAYGAFPTLILLWGVLAGVVFILLVLLKERGTDYLFHGTAILGMLCLAFAFGQNDLANCASPGLSSLWLWRHADEGIAVASKVDIGREALFLCGFFMAAGMMTRTSQRVTRAQVNTGSQFDRVALWAPGWCRWTARLFVKEEARPLEIAPLPSTTETGKRIHYDTLRASVIMAISASVIAFASGRGIPVSTTYVGFAAVVATGWGDRVFHRGDADLKIGRAIWVVTAWFLAALIAMVSSGVVAFVIYKLKTPGLVLAFTGNLCTRNYFRNRGNRHEATYHKSKEGILGSQDDEDS